jgi:hypothetical protein
MHRPKTTPVFIRSFLPAALIVLASLLPAQAQQTPSTSASASSVVQTIAPAQSDSGNTAEQVARDAQFVNCFLISCAGIGAIIAFVVWRSLPPKSKAGTKNN